MTPPDYENGKYVAPTVAPYEVRLEAPSGTTQLVIRILDRFGLPTLFALLTAAALVFYNKQVREDAKVERDAFIGALKENTASINTLANELRDHMQREERYRR